MFTATRKFESKGIVAPATSCGTRVNTGSGRSSWLAPRASFKGYGHQLPEQGSDLIPTV